MEHERLQYEKRVFKRQILQMLAGKSAHIVWTATNLLSRKPLLLSGLKGSADALIVMRLEASTPNGPAESEIQTQQIAYHTIHNYRISYFSASAVLERRRFRISDSFSPTTITISISKFGEEEDDAYQPCLNSSPQPASVSSCAGRSGGTSLPMAAGTRLRLP